MCRPRRLSYPPAGTVPPSPSPPSPSADGQPQQQQEQEQQQQPLGVPPEELLDMRAAPTTVATGARTASNSSMASFTAITPAPAPGQKARALSKSKLTQYLPETGYFIAGALAGGISRTATAPLDRLKVYLLVNTKPGAPLGPGRSKARPPLCGCQKCHEAHRRSRLLASTKPAVCAPSLPVGPSPPPRYCSSPLGSSLLGSSLVRPVSRGSSIRR